MHFSVCQIIGLPDLFLVRAYSAIHLTLYMMNNYLKITKSTTVQISIFLIRSLNHYYRLNKIMFKWTRSLSNASLYSLQWSSWSWNQWATLQSRV